MTNFVIAWGGPSPGFSGANTDFGRDYGVSFTNEELADGKTLYNFNSKPYPIRELPGLSVFTRDAEGSIHHTYSVFARGLEDFLTAYRYIDITPKELEDETQTGGMGWLRHHGRYDGTFVQPWEEKPGITGPLMK
ncbi:MAG: DUF899 family protein [Planctomycetales bacterium]